MASHLIEIGQVMAKRSLARLFLTSIIVPCALWTSLFSAWQVWAATDFGFAWLYDVVGIDANVNEYGPQNRYKKDFAQTTREERLRLFSVVAKEINSGGQGLAEIEYHRPDGAVIDTFLRPPEVMHLRDVARMVEVLRLASYCSLAVMLIGIALAWWFATGFPAAAWVWLTTVLLCAAGAVGISWYGAERLFYQWHTLVFPAGHQWFFYYQDSLMTTLMRAPIIFGYIAALLLATTLLFFAVLLWFIKILLRDRSLDANI